MKITKKTTTITILTILTLTIIVGVFWYVQESKQTQVIENQNNARKVVSNINHENQKKENSQEIKTETESIKTKPQLSKEEIEKLKKEKYLVWYKIPELGIKFLVTKDTKEDLGYVVKKDGDQYKKNGTVAFLYSQTESNYRKKYYKYDCTKKENGGYCEKGLLLHINVNADKFVKKMGCGKVVFVKNHDIVCYTGPQAFNWTNKEYQKYLKTIKNKHFGIYLNTIQTIK